MPAWTSESTVVKSSWIVAAGSVTGEGIAGMAHPWLSKSRPCLQSEPIMNEKAMRATRTLDHPCFLGSVLGLLVFGFVPYTLNLQS